MILNAVFRTDIGLLRSQNQDSVAVIEDLSLFLVADGIGGTAGGAVASRIAVDRIAAQVRSGSSLTEAIRNAHLDIRRAPLKGVGNPGMGTTVVAARFTGDEFQIAWVGDSRAYLLDTRGIEQLTVDHNMRQLLARVRAVDLASQDPDYLDMLTRCLGTDDDSRANADVVLGQLHKNQKLLLCSDGLTNELTDEQIFSIVQESPTLELAAEYLTDAANESGGRDNISIVLVELADQL